MINYLQYLLGYADLNEYEADEKSKRLKYLCCETIKNSKIKLKKVNCDKNDFPILQRIRNKRTKK